MRALVADDNQLRWEAYRVLEVLGWELQWARTAEVAALRLRDFNFDLVALDHDFKGARDCFEDPPETTGRSLAQAVAELEPKRRPKYVVLHSANVRGREAMARTLMDGGVPFVIQPLSNVLFSP